MKTADTILTNGRFLTMEDDCPTAEAMAIENGRVLYIGKESEALKFSDKDTKIIDLKGHVAAPAFIESHTHPLSYAHVLIKVNCRGEFTQSREALLDLLKQNVDKTPKGEWVYATGYDEGRFPEGQSDITKEDLDSIAPENPVFLRRTCGHLCVLNSLAMSIANLTDDDNLPQDNCRYFRDENGKLTGKFSTGVADKIKLPLAPIEKVEEGFEKVEEIFFEKGITTAADVAITTRYFKMAQNLERQGRLRLRLPYYHPADIKLVPEGKARVNSVANLGLQPGFGTEKLWFLGIKYVMDGSAGGKTAAFSLPYTNEPDNFGKLYYTQEEVNESVLIAAKAGVQASIHAIGDRAIEMALTAIEYANQNGADTTNLRYRLEHLEAPTADHIRRIKELNLAISLSSAFIYSLGDSHINVMANERLTDYFPAKTLMENGIPVACNSDCPVCDVNPMYGIYSLVTRTTAKGQSFGGKKEAVDRISALKAYTKNASFLLWCDDMLGTLKEGKYADIIVFEEDFINIPDEELKDVHICMTMQNGEVVYKKEF